MNVQKQSAILHVWMSSSPPQCANIGPADYNYDETISTLRYANRAKNIKNKARINEDPKDALLRQFQKEIEELKKKLEEGEELGCVSCFVTFSILQDCYQYQTQQNVVNAF